MSPAQPKQKKEKAKVKVPIPGTSWQRITTNEGNVFYFEKETKRSEWTIPEEIQEAVEVLEAEEKAKAEEDERLRKEAVEQERREKLLEMERLGQEVEEGRKKKAEEAERKRKMREAEADGEPDDQEPAPKVPKRAADGDDEEDEEADEGEYGPQDEADEAAWMQAVAAEFAAADAAKAAEAANITQVSQGNAAEAAKQVFSVPDKVNVSQEEGRALFKVRMFAHICTETDMTGVAHRERYLPVCTLGELSPVVHQRPAIRATRVRERSERGVRSVLPGGWASQADEEERPGCCNREPKGRSREGLSCSSTGRCDEHSHTLGRLSQAVEKGQAVLLVWPG